MKKMTISMLAIAVACSVLLPDSSSGWGFTGKGLKAGLNIAKLRGGNVGFEDSKLGLCTGAFVTYSVSDMFAAQAEVLYTMKGMQQEVEVTDPYGTPSGKGYLRYLLNYLEIPILARLSISVQNRLTPFALAGPYLAFRLSNKFVLDTSGESQEFDMDPVDSFDAGLVLGGGVDFGVGPGKLTTDVRYTRGLRTIYDLPFETDVKNEVISFTMGYSF